MKAKNLIMVFAIFVFLSCYREQTPAEIYREDFPFGWKNVEYKIGGFLDDRVIFQVNEGGRIHRHPEPTRLVAIDEKDGYREYSLTETEIYKFLTSIEKLVSSESEKTKLENNLLPYLLSDGTKNFIFQIKRPEDIPGLKKEQIDDVQSFLKVKAKKGERILYTWQKLGGIIKRIRFS